MNEKILVIDDEEGIRYTFDVFLSEDGYSVDTAGSYDEALELIDVRVLDHIVVGDGECVAFSERGWL